MEENKNLTSLESRLDKLRQGYSEVLRYFRTELEIEIENAKRRRRRLVLWLILTLFMGSTCALLSLTFAHFAISLPWLFMTVIAVYSLYLVAWNYIDASCKPIRRPKGGAK